MRHLPPPPLVFYVTYIGDVPNVIQGVGNFSISP